MDIQIAGTFRDERKKVLGRALKNSNSSLKSSNGTIFYNSLPMSSVLTEFSLVFPVHLESNQLLLLLHSDCKMLIFLTNMQQSSSTATTCCCSLLSSPEQYNMFLKLFHVIVCNFLVNIDLSHGGIASSPYMRWGPIAGIESFWCKSFARFSRALSNNALGPFSKSEILRKSWGLNTLKRLG